MVSTKIIVVSVLGAIAVGLIIVLAVMLTSTSKNYPIFLGCLRDERDFSKDPDAKFFGHRSGHDFGLALELNKGSVPNSWPNMTSSNIDQLKSFASGWPLGEFAPAKNPLGSNYKYMALARNEEDGNGKYYFFNKFADWQLSWLPDCSGSNRCEDDPTKECGCNEEDNHEEGGYGHGNGSSSNCDGEKNRWAIYQLRD